MAGVVLNIIKKPCLYSV